MAKAKTEYDKALEVREKPLNQTQLKNLRELVEGDFRDLQGEVMSEIERRLRRRIEEIEAQYKETADLDKAREKLRTESRKAEDKLRSVIEKILETESLESEYPVENMFEVAVRTQYIKQSGRDEAIRKAKNAAEALKTTALRVINREHRNVDRTCLLQGISSAGAIEIINDLPQPEDILPLVSAEMQMKESEAMDELMSDIKSIEQSD